MCWCGTSRRRSCGRGLCAQHGARGRGAGHFGARRGQHHHGAARCNQRFGAGAVYQRPGRDRGDRHPGFPGERRARHVAPGDQVEPAGARGGRCAVAGAPRAGDRRVRPAGAGAARCAEGHPADAPGPRRPIEAVARITHGQGGAAAEGDAAARGRSVVDGAPSCALWRWRVDQLGAGRLRGLRAAGAPPACALHADADGARRLPRVRPEVHRHAGHARHAGSESRDARGRPRGVRRRALR